MKQHRDDDSIFDYLKRTREELDEQTVAFAYYVDEVTPAYNTGGYYDQDIPEKRVRVSEFFDQQCYAEEWMDGFVPDEGKHFEIRRRRLIEKTIREWVDY